MPKNLIPTLLCDFYKVGHREQYPEGTEVVYSTWTPRSNKHFKETEIDSVVNFGLQAFVKEYLIDFFNENFFSRPLKDVTTEYVRYVKYTLFVKDVPTKHIEELHALSYLPIEIRSLPEGIRVPFRVPVATIHNTDSRFFWLTNYLETLASCEMWKPSTIATIAHEYRKILNKSALKSTGSTNGVEFQGHDFSMRGLSGIHDSATSSMGHLLSFVGTDVVPSIMGMEQYYKADIEKELVGTSVWATEHSVMCAGGKDSELETYRRLIQDVYPTGVISLVSDTWDLWHVLTSILPKLKDIILERNGGGDSLDKVVIRPDSGCPLNIICGDPKANHGSPENKGVIKILWETFGGTINDKGYKVLHPCIGAIYGEAITLSLCQMMCDKLLENGFASTNLIYGIGSYTYQYITRDTLGWAMKSTLTICKNKEVPIFKDPATDDGVKKSAKGGVAVIKDDNGKLVCVEGLGIEQRSDCQLDLVFKNGKLIKETSLAEIRKMLK